MVSDDGGWASGSAMRGPLDQKANSYCLIHQKQMMPVSISSEDAGYAKYADAELDFRCLSAGDPDLRRPNMQRAPDIRIENTTN